MDLAGIRALFPVTRTSVYLNHAAESPLNALVQQRLNDYLTLAAQAPHRKPSVRMPVRRLLASLLGGKPEEYALVTSTGVGLGLVAAGFPWVEGDNVVLFAEEHWNNTFPWLALRRRGVEVRVLPLDDDLRLNPERLAQAVDARTRMVTVAAVRHTTGYRADLQRLGQIAHRQGALLVVDGIQAAGVVPLNVDEDDMDVLACGGFKWLLGQPGTGFLYVRERAWERIQPVLPGMFAAEDDLSELRWLPGAQRYETGSIAYPLFHAWTAGLELLLEVGIPAIHARVLELTTQLLEGIRATGLQLVTPAEAQAERSAILSFTAESPEANQRLFDRLADDGIAISLRGGRCRVSPSFFNTQQEIDHFLAALKRV
jgi:selenocysteine lyase/cysteine desulfurase